jgi:lactam utilization protein B
MKLNLTQQLKTLDGKAVKDANYQLGKLLAHSLASSNKTNSIKLHDMALKLYNNQTIDVDNTDKEMLELIIDSSENLTVLAKAQLLKAIKEQSQPIVKKK